MESESEVSKNISNETICGYFYVMFLIVAVFAGIVFVIDVSAYLGNRRLGAAHFLRTLPSLVIAVLNSLFLYVLCSRTLLRK